MSFTVEDLNPKKPVLIIDNREIVLSFITLHHEVIFKDQYGGRRSNVRKCYNETSV